MRCALTPLTSEQERINLDAGWNATAIMYIPLKQVPSPRPEVSGFALVQADVEETAMLYAIKQVMQRVGRTLGHIQLYLTPQE